MNDEYEKVIYESNYWTKWKEIYFDNLKGNIANDILNTENVIIEEEKISKRNNNKYTSYNKWKSIWDDYESVVDIMENSTRWIDLKRKKRVSWNKKSH